MKRIRLISIVVAVIVLGGMSFAIFRAREPRYQGRTLTEWIQDGQLAYNKFAQKPNVHPSYPENDPDWQTAAHAVKQMAPDAIPFLLNWVQAKDSPLKGNIIKWSNKLLPSHFHIKRAVDYRSLAASGFMLLGSDAKTALPVLIEWTNDTDRGRRNWALQCLAASNPEKVTLMPVLLRLINDPDPGVQYTARWWFHNLYPKDAEALGIYKPIPPFTSATRIRANTN